MDTLQIVAILSRAQSSPTNDNSSIPEIFELASPGSAYCMLMNLGDAMRDFDYKHDQDHLATSQQQSNLISD
jgi:hypothetical protein